MKTRTTSQTKTKKSKSAAPSAVAALAGELAVGHRPRHTLSPQDEALFRAFQSNLLSLISHELRTPLMGILNSLGALDDEGESLGGGLSSAEWISMARRNAQRLQQTMNSLLDLAAMESGTYRLRLREVEWSRLVQGRLDACAAVAHERNLKLTLVQTGVETDGALLADSQKLGRALDLVVQVLAQWALPGSSIEFRVAPTALEVPFELAQESAGTPAAAEQWDSAWFHALTGFQAGMASSLSAFAGTVQSEQAFLSRVQEGLGSEFLLIHQILMLHHGTFEAKREGNRVVLSLQFPQLSSEDALKAVLASRMHQASGDIQSVALGIIEVPRGRSIEEFRSRLKRGLFRASDAVYALPERAQVALVMDDCKPEDVPGLLARLNRILEEDLRVGFAACPRDGLDPDLLFQLAEKRLS